MRLRSKRTIRSHRPFEGQGASLYRDGEFRHLRLWSGMFLPGAESTIGGNNVQKTARIDFVTDPTNQFLVDTTALANTTVEFQVRTFKDDVENESNFRPLTLSFDGDGEDVTSIVGRGVLLSIEIRAAGIVRLRFRWVADRSGLQPTSFLAIRTAGPSSPANATVTDSDGETLQSGYYEIDTPALLDSAPYTYKLQAKNGSATLDFITGITFTADATGPTAPTHGSVEII